ncbi:hypothetical protein PVK06_047581 [Gossypium arboreum]|uniref:Uncharacterized protein n=1 Tax=Gossypium arboreum TaxID=29729 RepID=A0ABR0MG92_GOSAR|nr:hypothetical protein PVK06_047581 [Gossypium arboreum]
MKETADSKVPSSDLGAFERAASATDSTDTTQKFPSWKEMGFLRKGVGNHRRTSNLTVLSNLEPTTLHILYCYRRHEYQLDYGTRTPEIDVRSALSDGIKEMKIGCYKERFRVCGLVSCRMRGSPRMSLTLPEHVCACAPLEN